MRNLVSALAWCIPAATTLAVPIVDQSHIITNSTGGRIVFAGNSPAQLFTVGSAGLLSQVDVLLRRDVGDIGGLALELWPVVAGGPAGSTPLFSAPINPNDVPSGSSSAYVPIDVTAGGLFVSPGDQLVIAVSGTADLDAPNASWTSGFPGYAAGGKFDRAGAWTLASSDFDYGFRTWVDPAAMPTGLPTLELTPTSEWQASLSASGASVIFTAGDTMRVDRLPAFDEDKRGLIEFDASSLPEGATLRSAKLDFEINQRSQSGSTVPAVGVYGYQATGTPIDADARNLSQFLGQSAPITDFDPVSIPLNVAQLSSMLNASPDIGLIAYGAVPNLGVNIIASQLANQLSDVYSPPRLTLGYSIDSYAAHDWPAGDYNRDAHVDAADYVLWRKTTGMPGSDDDFDVWRGAVGNRPDELLQNGDFEAGNLSGWNVIVGPNTNVSFGFPRVESFDVNGDGQPTPAFRVRLGRSDTDLFGGEVSIEQQILLAGGDYIFSADVASQSLEIGGNTGPGNYELTFDGRIVDQVLLNGTSIASMQIIRDSLQATLANVEPGYHTLRLTVARGATNTRAIYQFIDNIGLTRSTPSFATSVPEPYSATLFLVAVTLAAARRGSPIALRSRRETITALEAKRPL